MMSWLQKTTLIITAALFLLLSTATSEGNSHQRKIHRIAIITWRGETDAERGFMDSMKSSEFNVHFNVYYANQNLTVLKSIIGEINKTSYHLVYVFGTTATKTVMKHIQQTPIIFNIVNRPLASGIIKSWEKSGNNTTGASNQVPVENQLRTLKKVVDFRRLGIIFNPREQNSTIQRDIAHSFESKLSFKLIEYKITQRSDIIKVIPGLKGNVDAVFIPADSLINSLGKEISHHINSYHLPALTAFESLVTENGVLLGLVPDFYQLGQLAADKAKRVLNGENPSDIPSSTLEYFNLSVNMATARQTGIQIPMCLLIMANKIVR